LVEISCEVEEEVEVKEEVDKDVEKEVEKVVENEIEEEVEEEVGDPLVAKSIGYIFICLSAGVLDMNIPLALMSAVYMYHIGYITNILYTLGKTPGRHHMG
jgi:hypothetical protein